MTPPAFPSASWTVAAHEAQLIPSMGRTMRDLLMELVRGGRRAPLGGGGLHYEQAFEHVHAAAKAELARLLGCELHRRGLKRRERRVDPKVFEDDAVRAIRGLVAAELEPHRLPGPHHDRIGGITALHDHPHLLHTGDARRFRARPLRE